MPQLVSGRHVGLNVDRVLALARDGDFNHALALASTIRTPEDLLQVMDLVYFAAWRGQPDTSEPYLTGLTVRDISTDKCDWSPEEMRSFDSWLESPPARHWLRERFDELHEVLRTTKTSLPENLRGLFD
jgi:hypothetical protein